LTSSPRLALSDPCSQQCVTLHAIVASLNAAPRACVHGLYRSRR
jgi:hypothetical protein